jgi:hypothetical protein
MKRTPEQAREALEEMADHVQRIAAVIASRPVMGHWPHMKAEIDSALLIVAARIIRDIGGQLVTVAAIGHRRSVNGEGANK